MFVCADTSSSEGYSVYWGSFKKDADPAKAG